MKMYKHELDVQTESDEGNSIGQIRVEDKKLGRLFFVGRDEKGEIYQELEKNNQYGFHLIGNGLIHYYNNKKEWETTKFLSV